VTLASAVLLIGIAALGAASWDRLRAWIPAATKDARESAAPARVAQEPLIVPRSSEIALDRARALFESGRLHDALRAVDLVRPTDPLRAEADKLKSAIQRDLLAFQTLPGGTPTATATPATPGPATPVIAAHP
jgi:hypothetical protein